MEYRTIHPIKGPIDADIEIPPSKSFTHRALIAASLAQGTSVVERPLHCEDTDLTRDSLQAMGAHIEELDVGYRITGVERIAAPKDELYLGNSGSSLRLLTSIAALGTEPITLTGKERMQERPVKALGDALESVGVSIEYLKQDGYPPLRITGPFSGGTIRIPANVSSQFISSLLLAAPCCDSDTNIIPTTAIRSKPYIDITMDVMRDFGADVAETPEGYHVPAGSSYSPTEYEIEGDFSNASYFFAAAALLGGTVRLYGLNRNTSQGDKQLLEILLRMGCRINYEEDHIELSRRSTLKGVETDMSECPDVVQTVAVIAAGAETPTTITNIAHLKHKETDRINDTATELRKLGAQVETTEDSLTIHPVTGEHQPAEPPVIETYDDHRMAMSFAIAGLRFGAVISDPACVEKSFPDFFERFEQLTQPKGDDA